jgi:mannosyltransferase OCH1-like enzyme
MLIPKVIHYIWLGSKAMHPLMIQWRNKWAAIHPGWQIKIWREDGDLPAHCLVCDDEIIECRYPEFLARCPTYAKRSDVWRYEILDQQGGVYMDTDFEPVKNIEPLIVEAVAFAGLCDTRYGWDDANPQGFIKTEVACSIMGSVAHHPWLQELVAGVPNQDAVAQLSLAFPYLTQITAHHPDVSVFPQATFYPVAWDTYALGGKRSLVKEALPPETYAVHRWSSCWFPDGLKPRI